MTEQALYRVYIASYSTKEGIQEALRQTERHIEEQHRVVAAADQRAIAFSAVLMVVVGLLLDDKAGARLDDYRAWVIALYLFALALAVLSARPARLYGSGGPAATLATYVEKDSSGYLLSTLIRRNDKNIAHNERAIRVSTWIFRSALSIALCSTIILYLDWANAIGEIQK